MSVILFTCISIVQPTYGGHWEETCACQEMVHHRLARSSGTEITSPVIVTLTLTESVSTEIDGPQILEKGNVWWYCP